MTLIFTRWSSYRNVTRTPWRYTGCANMNFLRQGFRKLSSDRQTDTTEVINHVASRVVKIQSLPRYLSDRLIRVADVSLRSRLWSSTFNQLAVRPSSDHLLLLAWSWNSLRMMLHLLYHWQCFEENWKLIYFGSHIRTLLCSLPVAVLGMVVLAVISLDHINTVM